MWLWFDHSVLNWICQRQTSNLSPKHHKHYSSCIFCVPSSGPEKICVAACDIAAGRNSPAYWREGKTFLFLTHIPNMWSRCSWDERDLSLCVSNGGYFGPSDQACFIMSRRFPHWIWRDGGREKKTNEPRWSNKGSIVASHSPRLLGKQVFVFLLMREKVSERQQAGSGVCKYTLPLENLTKLFFKRNVI